MDLKICCFFFLRRSCAFLLQFLSSLQHYQLLNRFLLGRSAEHHKEPEVMATIESTTKNCILIQGATRADKRKRAQILGSRAQACTHSSPRVIFFPAPKPMLFPLQSLPLLSGVRGFGCFCAHVAPAVSL